MPASSVEPSVARYVVIPNDPMRGIRPSWMDSDHNEDVKVAPLPKKSKVWFISSTGRFDWYIPAILDSYIMEGLRVTSYVLSVDDERYQRSRQNEQAEEAEEAMKAADPSSVIRRWDGVPPICPVESLGEVMKSNRPFGRDGFDSLKVADQEEKRLAQAKSKYGDNLGFEGTTQCGLGPEMWGITLQQLREVILDPDFNKSVKASYGGERVSGGMTMYEVVQKIFKKKTAGKGIGYSLLVNQEKPIRAKVMVSHSWSEDYERFVSALDQSGEKGPFWVCAAAIYQCEDKPAISIEKQLGPDPSTGPFATVLKQADKMVGVVTPESDIYTRLWCVFEIYVAVLLGVYVQMAYFSESTGFGGSGQTYFNAAMDTAHIPVDTIKAGCSMTSDKEMIHAEVMKLDRGFDLLDDVIYWIKVTSLMQKLDVGRMETTRTTPFGISSASCAGARVNAAIAKVLETWEKSQDHETKSEHRSQDQEIKSRHSLCNNCSIS